MTKQIKIPNYGSLVAMLIVAQTMNRKKNLISAIRTLHYKLLRHCKEILSKLPTSVSFELVELSIKVYRNFMYTL